MEYDDADMAFKCLSPIAETLDSIWEETYEETQQSLPLSFKGSHSSEILTMEHTRMEPTQISRNEENGIGGSDEKQREKGQMARYAFRVRWGEDVLEDGYKWRKYGKKPIKSSPHPRNYYKCSENNCRAKKRVERDPRDPDILILTYQGSHSHHPPPPPIFRTVSTHSN